MSEIILKTDIPREKGYLYFCGTGKDGNLLVCKAVMARNGRGKSKKKSKK